MKKWLKRLVVGLGILAVALVFLFLVGSLVARQLSIRRAERDFPAPGRLVDIDGRLSHIHCTGRGSPTILLESGLDDRGSWSWAGVQEELSHISRVCAYDRAGVLWSEPREEPRDAERIADELHAVLSAASEAPPYVMVGHSLGGALVRVYDHRYPGETAGFVFVDASHPEQDDRFPAEVRERIAQADSDGPPRWFLKILAPYRFFIGERRTPRTAYFWRSFPEGVLGEVAAANAIFEQARRTGSLGNRPVVVLTAGVFRAMPGISEEGSAAMRQTLLELQAELAVLSTNSDHRVVEGAGHYIHRDQPQAVVAAIRDVVAAARQSGPVRSETGPATKADFDALIGYFTAGSATWQQDNAEPGEGEPTHWVRRHTADGNASTVQAVAAYADGRCESVTTIVYRWAPDERTITAEARAGNGLSLGGLVEPLGDSRYRTTIEGVLPDGSELKMRDTTDLSDPESTETTAERWVDGEWVPLDSVAWRRVPRSAWCGDNSPG